MPPTTASPSSPLQMTLQKGLALHQAGKLAEARAAYEAALAQDPDHADALHLRGVLYTQLERDHQRALALIERAIAKLPGNAAFYANRGIALQELRRYDAALSSYDRAIALKPDYAEAWSNRGAVLQLLKLPESALASYEAALRIKPDYAQAHFNRGNVLKELRHLDAALAAYEHALKAQPDFAEAHANRATLLRSQRRLDEAIAAYDRAIALKPDYVAAIGNRGNVFLELQLFDAALANYEQAIARAPAAPDAYLNKALCHLLQGQYADGWPLYEYRWKSNKHGLKLPPHAQPRWTGEQDVRGKTVLVYAEQGFGDSIQFCRFAALLRERGARVILQVPTDLVDLLHTADGPDQVLSLRAKPEAFDYHCPMLSLPLALSITLDTVPSAPAYLRTDPERVRQWQARLGTRRQPRIGLAWSGNAGNKNDDQRSLRLQTLLDALPPDAELISLQKEVRPDDQATLRASGRLRHFGAELKDFSDTAALASQMDLILTVDTSVAHLAGALGLPAWVLLPYTPDWRWLLERTDSPWYPSLRLFRQERDGRWDSVLQNVASALSATFAKNAL